MARPGPGGETPRDIVRKALEAQGGKKSLARHLTYRCRRKGTLTEGDLTASVTMDFWWSHPNRSRLAVEYVLGEVRADEVTVLNGDRAWRRRRGETRKMPAREVKAMQAGAQVTYARALYPLLEDAGFALTLLDEIKVNGRAAVGVRVASKGHDDFRLYFDKASGLLVKAEWKGVTSGLQPIRAEQIFSDYKPVKGGGKYPMKALALIDGKKFLEDEVVEFEPLDKIDDALFAEP
jgi:hypothetical protein